MTYPSNRHPTCRRPAAPSLNRWPPGGWQEKGPGAACPWLLLPVYYSVALWRDCRMSVKASVSLTEQQDAFARDLVRQGRYASLSAVVQRGLELLREETEAKEPELAALRALLAGARGRRVRRHRRGPRGHRGDDRRQAAGAWPFEVVRSRASDRDLEAIFDHLVAAYQASGDAPAEALGRAAARVRAIEDDMERLGRAPFQGTLREDLRPGLRQATRNRAVFAFRGGRGGGRAAGARGVLRRPGPLARSPDCCAASGEGRRLQGLSPLRSRNGGLRKVAIWLNRPDRLFSEPLMA